MEVPRQMGYQNELRGVEVVEDVKVHEDASQPAKVPEAAGAVPL